MKILRMKRFTYSVISCLFLFLYGCGYENTSSLHDSNVRIPTLSIIGDSLSTGVMASSKFAEPPPKSLFNRMWSFLKSGDYNRVKLQKVFSEPKSAAATTLKRWGLRAKIAELSIIENIEAKHIDVYFAASFGGRLKDVPDYLDRLEAEYARRNNGRPSDYVLFMLGGNDFCADISPKNFKNSFKNQIKATLDTHPNSKVIVSSVPPVASLTRFEHDYYLGPAKYLSCKDIRKAVCSTVYKDHAQDLWLSYNQSIAEVIDALDPASKRRIVKVNEIGEMRLSSDMLSFDCFHPSENGQKEFAKLINQKLSSL